MRKGAATIFGATALWLLIDGNAIAASPCDPATNAEAVAKAREGINRIRSYVQALRDSGLPIPSGLARAMGTLDRFAFSANMGVDVAEAAGQADYEVQKIIANKKSLCEGDDDEKFICYAKIDRQWQIRNVNAGLNWNNPGSVVRRAVDKWLGAGCNKRDIPERATIPRPAPDGDVGRKPDHVGPSPAVRPTPTMARTGPDRVAPGGTLPPSGTSDITGTDRTAPDRVSPPPGTPSYGGHSDITGPDRTAPGGISSPPDTPSYGGHSDITGPDRTAPGGFSPPPGTPSYGGHSDITTPDRTIPIGTSPPTTPPIGSYSDGITTTRTAPEEDVPVTTTPDFGGYARPDRTAPDADGMVLRTGRPDYGVYPDTTESDELGGISVDVQSVGKTEDLSGLRNDVLRLRDSQNNNRE